MKRIASLACLTVLAALAATAPAQAGYDSVYTDFAPEDPKLCTDQSDPAAEGEPEGSVVFDCKGHDGYTVTFAEGDLRSFMSYWRQDSETCSLRQTFSGFNSVGKKIEWRLKDGKPFATIFRWSVSYDPEDSTKQKQWLVVTKIGDDANSCHVGYVEGGYPKANEKARWLADTAAEAFDCKAGIPIFFANSGTQTDGIVSGGCDY